MRNTHILKNPIFIKEWANIAGQKESEGKLSGKFDISLTDDYYGEQTWEKAESKMQSAAIKQLLLKAKVSSEDVDFLLAGDLSNQCTGSTFGIREFKIPTYGQYGACSTMAQSLSVAALILDGCHGENAICATSSHFESAEKQFRFPNDYGALRTPTAQWTVTGSVGVLLYSGQDKLNSSRITSVTTGKIIDWGETDANNMGSAMAPAAADTLVSHFENTNTKPNDYALILTGDLGAFGAGVLRDLMENNEYPLGDNYLDCGTLIYNTSQDVGSGGSGCACSGIVLTADVLPKMKNGEIKGKVLFVGTGALLSTISSQQNESIPGIAHLVEISNI